MLDDAMCDFENADGEDQEKIERAVALLYRHLHLPRPKLHWEDSIYDAMLHAEGLRSVETKGIPPGPTLGQRCNRAFKKLAKQFNPDPEWPASYVPRFYNVARLEHHDGVRAVRPWLAGPREYYREQIGESLATDEPKGVLSHGWTPFHEFFTFQDVPIRSVLRLHAAIRKSTSGLSNCHRRFFDAMLGLAANCYWVFLTGSDVIVSKSPNMCLWDVEGRPHGDSGPAIITRDRHEVFALHGVWVPREVVMEPQALRLQDIEVEPEVDTRALMIEAYGLERYMQDAGALLWHKDEFGELFWRSQHQQSPVLAVRVRNKTLEIDGSCKEHWIRVPPHIATAREAVAWTFAMEERDYQPTIET